MRKLLFAAAALAGLSLANSASAQSDWSGPYVGAQAGWGFQSENDDETIQFDNDLNGSFGDVVLNGAGANAFSPGFCNGAASGATPAAGCSDRDDGFEFGGRVGYDWQFGNFVLGVLGEATRTNVEDSVSAFSTTPASYTMTRELNGLLAARARAGYALGETLLYATGGYARGYLEHRFETTNTANTFTASDDEQVDGWQLGAGVEHKITQDVSLGLEYLYTSLKDDEYRVRAAGGPAGGPFTAVNATGTDFARSTDDFEVHSVRLTAAYRF